MRPAARPRPTLFDSIGPGLAAVLTDGAPQTDGLPSDLIEQAGAPYMERFYLLGDKMSGGSQARFNHMVASDIEVVHDHPWDFVSVILSGSYVETTPTSEQTFGPGSVIVRPAELLHRLTLVDGPVWTMVVLGPPRRRWGYQTAQGWQHWSDYQAAHS